MWPKVQYLLRSAPPFSRWWRRTADACPSISSGRSPVCRYINIALFLDPPIEIIIPWFTNRNYNGLVYSVRNPIRSRMFKAYVSCGKELFWSALKSLSLSKGATTSRRIPGQRRSSYLLQKAYEHLLLLRHLAGSPLHPAAAAAAATTTTCATVFHSIFHTSSAWTTNAKNYDVCIENTSGKWHYLTTVCHKKGNVVVN